MFKKKHSQGELLLLDKNLIMKNINIAQCKNMDI